MTQRKETRAQSFLKLSLWSFYRIEQGKEIKKNKSKCRYSFTQMQFGLFCEDIQQNEMCLR